MVRFLLPKEKQRDLTTHIGTISKAYTMSGTVLKSVMLRDPIDPHRETYQYETQSFSLIPFGF